MGPVSAPELAPRSPLGGIIAVWVVAAVAAIAIGVFVPVDWQAAWLIVGLGGIVILSFVVQLPSGRSKGYISRVATSMVGALLLMGLVSAGFGLAAIL